MSKRLFNMPVQVSVKAAVPGGPAAALLFVLSFMSGVATAQQVQAQAEDKELTEIVITGSRIRGVVATGSAITVLNRDEIVEAGAPTTAELLRKLPAVLALGANETVNAQTFAQNGAANLTRATSVNLRGLGANSTLLLLNGRRLPASGLQAQITDASVIPSLVLERMEVVADGGSAIYGSDAVAGVVNMVPRTRFVGQESTLRYGFADGYSDRQIGHLAGFKWNSGHLVIAGDYSQHTELLGRNRDFYRQDLRSSGGSDFRDRTCRPGTITPAGSTTTYAIPVGGVTSANASTLVPGSVNLCDSLPNAQILAPLERTSFFGSAEQELNTTFTLFADAFWSRKTFTQTAGAAGGTFTITPANPYYPVGLRGVVGAPPLNVQYDLYPETGPITVPGHAQSWQATAGLRANLAADWQFSIYGSHGASEDLLLRSGTEVNTFALGPAGLGGSTNPAVAFNPFTGVNNPATLSAGRSGTLTTFGETALDVLAADANGPVFPLGGGAARLAVGGEYRKEKLDGYVTVTAGPSLLNIPNANARSEWAAFSEFFLPFVDQANALAGIRRLNLSLAARYEKYSDFGSTLNPKVGLVWTPVSLLDVRGSWGRSFRAPGLNEANPKSSGYGLYGDTLACNHIVGQASCQGISIVGGNADLKPEKAKTWSAGLDFHPDRFKGFHASLTYFNIDYTNQVLTLRGTSGLLTNPLYAPYRTLNPTAAQVNALLAQGYPVNTPLPANPAFIQDGRAENVGATMMRGVDFDVNQQVEIGGGALEFGLQGTRYTKLEQSLVPGAPNADVLNLINFPQKFRARGSVGWKSGALSAQAVVNHTGSYDQQRTPIIVEIGSWTTADLNFGYALPARSGAAKGLSLGLNLTNVFNADPPFVNQAGAYDPQAATATGRLIAISLRKDW